MGLPLWTAPQECKSTTEPQVDKDQARARSTIRRQRTVRGRDVEARNRRLREVHDASTAAMRVPVQQDVLTRVSSSRSVPAPTRTPNIPPPDSNDTAGIGSTRDNPLSHLAHQYFESPTHRPTSPPSDWDEHPDIYVYRRAGARLPENVGSDMTALPPRPRPSDATLSRTSFEERFDRRAQLYELYEEAARMRGLREDGNGDSTLPPVFGNSAPSPPLPSFSAGFAPALRYLSESSGPSSRQSPPIVDGPTMSDENSVNAAGFPPLRRMGRRPIAETMTEYSDRYRRRRRRQIMDGLGDRDRSISPEGDGAWETLLTTLTPDPQPPSASSSFAMGSAASSATSAVNSAGTSMTSVDNSSTNTNPCEYETEEQSAISDLDDDVGGSADHTTRPRRFWRSHSTLEPASTNRYPTIDSPTGLTGMLSIVRRLASRQDIPDEWWAEAGLSRNIPRNGSEAPIR